MFATKQIDDSSTQQISLDPLERLQDQLADLLLIHHQTKHSETLPEELPSLFLHGYRYVFGEKSAGKCSMRFVLKIGPDQEGLVTETVSLELSVRNTAHAW